MKRECSLCGGKLLNGVCMECGMDNRKSDDMYKDRLNKADCDQKGMSHIHEAGKTVQYQIPALNRNKESAATKRGPEQGAKRTKEPQQNVKNLRRYNPADTTAAYSQRARRSQPDSTSKSKGSLFAVLMIAALFLFIVITAIGRNSYSFNTVENISQGLDFFQDDYYNDDYDYDYDYDPYAHIGDELNEEGGLWKDSLSAGMYIVGVDLPEGEYTVSGQQGSSLRIHDQNHKLFVSENFGKEEYEVDMAEGVKLFDGALVWVDGMNPVVFETRNGQIEDMRARQENPVKDTARVTDSATAGVDFPAGTYDVMAVGDGFGIFEFQVEKEILAEDTYQYEIPVTVMMEANPSEEYPAYCPVFKNVVLPEGTVVHANDFTVQLVPSEGVTTTEYRSFYDIFY